MKKYLKLWGTFFKYSLINAVEYKLNFFLGGLFEFFWVIANFIFFKVIYENATDIAGWVENEVLLLVFVCGLIDSIHSFLCATGYISIPGKINSGELDFLILKPINNRFYMAFQYVNIGQIFNIIFNFIMTTYFLFMVYPNLGAGKVVLFYLLVLNGLLIVNTFYFMLSMLAFWVIQVSAIIGFSQELFTIGNKPINIYPKVLQKIFTFIVPFAVAFSYPVLFLKNELSVSGVMMSFVISIIFFLVSCFVYKKGIKRYSSASS